jgi:hypothetical protein
VVGLEWVSLSLVRISEELNERKCRGISLENGVELPWEPVALTTGHPLIRKI